jgi:hypothetical protein
MSRLPIWRLLATAIAALFKLIELGISFSSAAWETKVRLVAAIAPTKAGKHWLHMHWLGRRNTGIGITHLCPGNHATFEHQIWFNPKECRMPETEIGKFTHFDRTNMIRNAMGDRWVDCIFSNITLSAEIVGLIICLRIFRLVVPAAPSFCGQFARCE